MFNLNVSALGIDDLARSPRNNRRTNGNNRGAVNNGQFYWVDGPWPGRLALSPRPRGGDWLEDELIQWHQNGIDTVVSLLTQEEESDLALQDEAELASALGLDYLSYPIEDRNVPESESKLAIFLEKLAAQLARGKNVLLHCRQGVGRTGLVAACLLTMKGMMLETAVSRLSIARGILIPETPEQLEWIRHFAESAVSTT